MDEVPVSIEVNGSMTRAFIEARLTLADFLREECSLTGTHLACEHGVCGACTVLLDGQAVRSCLMFAIQAVGSSVTTIEGLTPADGTLSLGAAGVLVEPRAAVRVLHAGLRRLCHRLLARQPLAER